MRALVTGATGFVGGRLVPALLDAGHDVVALVRDADRYDAPDGVTVVEGDLLEPGSFETALDVDVAYYLVHSMHAGGDYAERDRRAARNFARAASETGVDRVVYLGGLGEERDRLSTHLRSRREVEAVLAEGSYALDTVRAAIVVGDGSASFEMIADMARRLPVMVTPQWVRTECQPVAVDDLIAALVAMLDHPDGAGLVPTSVDGNVRTYEIGGPDVLTYGDLLRRTADAMDRTVYLVPVPILSPRLSSYWVGLVTDVPAGVARPLIEGLKNPVVVHGESLQRQLGIEPTPFDEAVRRALAGGDGGVDVDGADSGDVDADAGSDDVSPTERGHATDDVDTGSGAHR